MFDFQKTEVFGVQPEQWLNNPLLDFEVKKSVRTDQERSKRIAHYQSLDFIIVSTGRMFIHGSLHMYFNFMKGIKAPNQKTANEIKKGFNGNDYTLLNFVETLMDIEERFNVRFDSSVLHNLESGVNLLHAFITKKILNNLMLHCGDVFNSPIHEPFREVEQSHYYVKVYDKQKQYGLLKRLLRFELKYMKMYDLNKLGIYCLNDLLNKDVLKRLEALLIKQWDRILMFDYTIKKELLKGKEYERALLYSNQNYWVDLAPNRRHRPKQYYKKLEAKYGEHVQNQIKELISEKWNELCNT